MPGGFLGPLETLLPPAEFVAACAKVIDLAIDARAGHAIERLEVGASHVFDREAESLRAWVDAVRPAIDPDFDKVASA